MLREIVEKLHGRTKVGSVRVPFEEANPDILRLQVLASAQEMYDPKGGFRFLNNPDVREGRLALPKIGNGNQDYRVEMYKGPFGVKQFIDGNGVHLSLTYTR